jgi:uncharacterized protein DUF2779
VVAHRADAESRVTHHEFLADTRADRRPAFADALLHALRQSNGPILVWSAFESYRLTELAVAPTHRAVEIASVHLVFDRGTIVVRDPHAGFDLLEIAGVSSVGRACALRRPPPA